MRLNPFRVASRACSTSASRVTSTPNARAVPSAPNAAAVFSAMPQAQAEKLREEAQRLGVAPEELARAALADLLGTPDAEFRAVATRILHKNQELYRRLA